VLKQTARKQRPNEQTADLVPLVAVRDQEAKQNDEAQQAYEGRVTSFLFFMEVIMQFVPWKTHFDFLCQRSDGKLDLDTYCKQVTARHATGASFLKNRLIPFASEIEFMDAEVAYLKRGRPYYNFHSSMIEPAKRIKLDKIPAAMIDVPRDFQTVNLRFPDSMEYTSLLVTRRNTMIILYMQSRTALDDKLIFCRLDTHAATASIETYLEEWVDTLPAESAASSTENKTDVLVDTIRDVLRCYVVTQFLADCPDENLIEYDILSKHRGEWVHATPERKLEIIELARQKGKKGWNIGVSSVLLADAPRLSAPKGEVQDPSGELRHSHIRTGHLHCVRCGKNKGDVKIMWYRPTVVRPDLPFKP
jgi:hypothetical protein